jgi:hypothetical protein
MMARLLIGIIVVAAVSAAGDYVWYEIGVEHRMWAGILHGAVLLTAVGGTLGAATGRTVAGLPIGTVAGVAGAVTYYALVPVLRSAAMMVAWASLWIVLAVLDGRLVRRAKRSVRLCLVQGATAALLSGVTFYLVVASLWGRPPAGGRNYALQFAMWAIAWAPGILAIGQELGAKKQDQVRR